MAKAKKIIRDEDGVIHEEGAHELGGTLGMTAGGVAGGIAGGAAAGASVGATAGPIGIVAGAAIGGALGGAAGESIARTVNPTDEELYWENNFYDRPYISSDDAYENYRSAYRYGVDSYMRNPNRPYQDVSADLGKKWSEARGQSPIEWVDAEPATRDAYDRLYSRRHVK